MLKSLVVQSKTRLAIENATDPWSKATGLCAQMFLSNLKVVAFYAVPHAGSSNIPKYVNKLLRCYIKHHCGIMDNIRPWQRDMEQLSVDFDHIVTENEIIIYAFCEGRPMEQVVCMCWMDFFCNLTVMMLGADMYNYYDWRREYWRILARHND